MIKYLKLITLVICLYFLNSQVHGSHEEVDDDQQSTIRRLSFALQKGYVKILGNKASNRLIHYLEGYDDEGFKLILNQIFQKEAEALKDSSNSDCDHSTNSCNEQERSNNQSEEESKQEEADGVDHVLDQEDDDVQKYFYQGPRVFYDGQSPSSSSCMDVDDRGMSISFNDAMSQSQNSSNPFWELNQKVDKKYGFLTENFMGSDVWGGIDLRENSLICMPSSFDNVHGLKTINLKENLFKVFPQPLVKASSLTTINLSHNFIGCWKGLEKCVNLEKLSLKDCLLEEIPEFIWSMENLVSLNLSENPITDWNAGDITAPLSTLKISHTGLDSFNLIDEKILNFLEYLDVSFNGITVIPRQWSFVKHLNMEGNPIQEFLFLSPTFEKEQRIVMNPRNLMKCLLRKVYNGAIVQSNFEHGKVIVSKNDGQITFVLPQDFYDEE